MSQPLGSKPEKSGPAITWRGIVLILILVVVGIFVITNWTEAPVNFFGLTLTLPLGLLVVIVFALGVLLGGLVRGAARKLRKPKPVEPKK
jgi:uncharacterized integral membrane protein